MEEAAAEPPDLTSRALEALTADPGIKVAVLGDVHGNVHALRAVLQDARKRGAEVCINTGDFLGYGAEPEEVVRLIRSTPSINIVGNYDLKVFRVHGRGQGKEEGPTGKSLAFQWAYEHISPSSREWLLSLPKEVRLEIGGKRILLVHGSPFCMEEHVGPGTSELRLWEIASSSNADLLIFGHSHQAMSREISGTHFLNPGSVGRQDDGDPRASYAVLRLSPFDAEIYRVDYDMEGAAKAVRSKGLPEVFAQMILQGLSYDQLIGKEAEREALEAEERLEGVRQVSRSYLGEDAHTEQVVRLSAALFDSLAMELSLAQKDRFLLASAALLHDIGWVEGGEGHHKVSQRIILEEEGLSMDRKERIMISCIARYHRKGLPDKRHAHFSTLSKEDRRRVTHLSAILRVADALDRTHGGQVQSLSCELTPGKITVRYTAATDLGAEEAATYQKGDLLEKILERKLEVVRDVG
jgi:putative phosphoesterase